MKLLIISEGKHELSGSLETIVRRLTEIERTKIAAKIHCGKVSAAQDKHDLAISVEFTFLPDCRGKGA